MAQPSLIVAQLVEHSRALGPGFMSRSGKTPLAFFGVFKDSNLEYGNGFMAAHIALHEKVFFG